MIKVKFHGEQGWALLDEMDFQKGGWERYVEPEVLKMPKSPETPEKPQPIEKASKVEVKKDVVNRGGRKRKV